jgi:hypothetical protein|eukprot:COSAG01_NODE_28400_length_661_cov_77.316726_1_plen_200_part_01
MGRGGAGDIAVGSSYGSVAGFIFIFNLVVGTGALALPKAMVGAGWLLSLVFLCVVAVMAFVSATFVIEAQAAANAMLRHAERGGGGAPRATGEGWTLKGLQPGSSSLNQPLKPAGSTPTSDYEISSRVEMTYMGELLGATLGPAGAGAKDAERRALMGSRVRNFYSVALVAYLYGDLAVCEQPAPPPPPSPASRASTAR